MTQGVSLYGGMVVVFPTPSATVHVAGGGVVVLHLVVWRKKKKNCGGGQDCARAEGGGETERVL